MASAVSNGRNWVGGPLWDSKHPGYNQLELISTATGERKLLEVPFRFAGSSQPVFLPNDRSVLAFGQSANDTTSTQLYMVPLDGGTPRSLARVPNTPVGAAVSVSPDGRFVAYSFQASRSLNLLLVDLRAESRTSPSKSSRR